MAVVGHHEYRLGTSSLSGSAVWRAQLACFVLLLTWAYAYWPTIQAMGLIYWGSPADRHCFFIIPLTLWLCIFKQKPLSRVSPCSSQLGLVLISLQASAWAFSYITGVIFLQHLMVVSMIPTIIYFSYGFKITRILLFPLCYLFLLLPIGYLFFEQLQDLLTQWLVNGIAFSGIPVFWEDTTIRTTQSTINANGALKGAQYILGYFAFGIWYSVLLLRSLLRRILLSILFITVPLIFNYIILYAMAYSEILTTSLNIPDYYFVNIAWYAIVSGLAFCLLLGYAWHKKDPNLEIAYDITWQTKWYYSNLRWFKPTTIAVLVLLVAPWVADNVKENPWKSKGEIIFTAPDHIYSWSGPFVVEQELWQPNFPNFPDATKTFSAEYRKGDREVDLFSAYYYSPIEKTNLISTANSLYDLNKWEKVKTNVHYIQILNNGKEEKLPILETIITSGTKHRVMWYWYHVANIRTSNRMLVQLLDSVRVLANMGEDSGIIVLSTNFTFDLNEGRNKLNSFMQDLTPELDKIMHPPRKIK